VARSVSILNRSKEAQEKYWTERAERAILAAEKTSEEMTADLAKLYREAQKAIQKEIESFYGKWARDVGVSLEDARKALNKSELKSYLEQTQAYYDAIKETGYAFDPAYRQKLHRQLSIKSAVSRLEALQSDCQWQIEKLYAREQDAFREGLSGTYEDAYYRTLFNIQQGLGFGSPFSTLNVEAIEKAVSQKWLGENYSDRIWTDKDRLTIAMGQIIPRGIALGQNPRIIGKDIADQLDVRRSYGERLARTEFNFIANQASKQAYKAAGVAQYKILATLDHRTSEICADMDGKLFNVGEEEPGINFPPFHPNCRTTTIPYFEPDEIDAMFDDVATRIARDPTTGKNYYVPADMTYKEWRESLTEEQGKVFMSTQKREKYYENDKEQLAGYRKFLTAAKKEHGEELVSGLFADFPTTIGDFQEMKYLETDKWEVFKENRRKLK